MTSFKTLDYSLTSPYPNLTLPYPTFHDLFFVCVEKSDVVCCTLSGAGSQPILEVVMRIPGFKFDAVIIGK